MSSVASNSCVFFPPADEELEEIRVRWKSIQDELKDDIREIKELKDRIAAMEAVVAEQRRIVEMKIESDKEARLLN